MIKEGGIEVNVNDEDVIQYEGIYYTPFRVENAQSNCSIPFISAPKRGILNEKWCKTVNNIIEPVKTTLVGVVECCRSTYYNGVEGIYVKPLYVLDILANEWYKIVGLEPPKTKYFYYPHLLMLSQHNMYPSCYYPIYSLETCENKSLEEFTQLNVFTPLKI